jgi:hypothetical protein
MSRAQENPDRDFSPDGVSAAADAEALRGLLKRGEVADYADPTSRRRIGDIIARSVSNPLPLRW